MALTFGPDVWERMAASQKPLFLYGMGDGADKILAVCAQKGIQVAGVFASDAFVRGQSFRGYPVLRLAQVEEQFGDVLVALCFASDRPEVLAQIEAVAQRHELVAPDVPVKGEGVFDTAYFEAHRQQLEEVYAQLADETSRRTLEQVLRYKLTGDIQPLLECAVEKKIIYQQIIRPNQREHYVDLGAYTGDTVEELLAHTGGQYASIVAVEPDKRNFKKLVARMEHLGLSDAKCLPYGIWDKAATLGFSHSSGRQAALQEQAAGETPADSVDNLLAGAPASIIKYDVEGAEQRALLGSRKTIAAYAPRLMVSAYHRNEDLFALPALIWQLNPGYALYLRHLPYIPAWETNFYAVLQEH